MKDNGANPIRHRPYAVTSGMEQGPGDRIRAGQVPEELTINGAIERWTIPPPDIPYLWRALAWIENVYQPTPSSCRSSAPVYSTRETAQLPAIDHKICCFAVLAAVDGGGHQRRITDWARRNIGGKEGGRSSARSSAVDGGRSCRWSMRYLGEQHLGHDGDPLWGDDHCSWNASHCGLGTYSAGDHLRHGIFRKCGRSRWLRAHIQRFALMISNLSCSEEVILISLL